MRFDFDDYCFACGKKNEYGLKLIIKAEGGISKSMVKFPDYMQGYNGIVHGGLISTVLDELAIYAGMSLGRQFVTGEITVRFKKALKAGKEYIVEGEVVEDRGKIVATESRIKDSKGILYASAKAKLMQVDDSV